jgi:hypothetical protein
MSTTHYRSRVVLPMESVAAVEVPLQKD